VEGDERENKALQVLQPHKMHIRTPEKIKNKS
jgi:hypothetical protein